ncbi:MAG: hypothetical protein CL932_14925 [Deltaproteobacteria bacterium]|nr:hypothetical protein [Deltaproteobacteria bacterium]|tara:strand:+ start:1974 stop:2240 length:267 start_codon:yes stop_codon:yes gene_type:complete
MRTSLSPFIVTQRPSWHLLAHSLYSFSTNYANPQSPPAKRKKVMTTQKDRTDTRMRTGQKSYAVISTIVEKNMNDRRELVQEAQTKKR